MLHSIVAPNVGHPLVHHFGERAAVWGQGITPSIAHLIQNRSEISIDYSRVRPGIVFETLPGLAMLPHVVNASTLRLHAEASSFHRAARGPDIPVDSVLQCEAGEGCVLRLWGRISAESSHLRWERLGKAGEPASIPVLFNLAFWMIARVPVLPVPHTIDECCEKDRKIRELELKIALVMSSH